MDDKIIQFRDCTTLRDHALVKDDVWVRNGKIINPEPLFYEERQYADLQIHCGGAIIAPGFIDVQINGGFGVDFSNSEENSIEDDVGKVAQGILAHGVTSFCPTLVTSPSQIYKKLLPRIKKKAGGSDGATVLGAHIEGPFISKEKRGAHSTQHIRPVVNGFQDFLDVYGSLENCRLLTLAPEIDQADEIITKLVHSGVTVSLGHSMGNLSHGEKAVESGASFITHLFNAMLPFHHRDPGLVGLLASDNIPKDRTVYYGIIADGIHTHPAALRIAHRTHPKGLVLVTDAVSPMGLPEGRHRLGQEMVDIIGSRALIAGTETLCGSIATMNQCVKTFLNATGCSFVEALESASLHPAQALNIVNAKGTMNYGSDADFVMLDQQLNVLATYIAGECVWKSQDYSSLKFTEIKKHSQ